MKESQEALRHKALPIQVFDFFSGCGGTCRGFQDAGMVIVGAIDNDPDSQMSFRHNFPDTFLNTCGIEDLSVGDLQPLITQCEDHPILFSVSAPCQPFTNQKTNKPLDDPRFNLLDEFIEFVEFYLPDYLFLENGAYFGANWPASRSKLATLSAEGGHRLGANWPG